MNKHKKFVQEIVANAHTQNHSEIVKQARELLGVEPKFQVGDKVRIKGGFVYDDYQAGEYETIKRITEEGKYVLNDSLPLSWHEAELEPYEGKIKIVVDKDEK